MFTIGAPLPPSPSPRDGVNVGSGHHGIVVVSVGVVDRRRVRRGENIRNHALGHVYVVGRIHATSAQPG